MAAPNPLQRVDKRRSFLLQRVQGDVTGLIDGSLSRLAPALLDRACDAPPELRVLRRTRHGDRRGHLYDPLGHGPFAFIGETPAFVLRVVGPALSSAVAGTTQPARRRPQLA
jgi:hypothetical protein